MKYQSAPWILVVFLFLFQPLAKAEQMYGIFMVVKGAVKVQSPKTGDSDVKVGVKVFEGDTVVTGADSRAKIVMSDRNVINISPDTKLQIAKYQNDVASGNKNVQLNLSNGKVRTNVEQAYDGAKSKFLIKTPTAVAGVRGTQFLTGFDAASKITSIVTFKGAVSLASIGPRGDIIGAPVVVKKGETTTAAPNAPPKAPQAMPKDQARKMDVETASTSSPSDNKSDTKSDSKSDNKSKRDVASDSSGGNSNGSNGSTSANSAANSSTKGGDAPPPPAAPPTPSMLDRSDMDLGQAKNIQPPTAVPLPVAPPRLPTATVAPPPPVDPRGSLTTTHVIVKPGQ